MDKIYTGAGDKGYTKTLSNFRISKSDAVIDLLGTADEFTASLLAAGAEVTDADLRKDIYAVVKRMKAVKEEFAGGNKTVTPDCVKTLEKMIDSYSDKIVPGENPEKSRSAAMLFLALSVAGRMERCAVRAGQFGRMQPAVLAYVNRLCDLIKTFALYQDSADKSKQPSDSSIREFVPERKETDMAETSLTLSLAKKLSEVIERKAAQDGVKVVVAIVDAGANLILLHATDDAYIASVQIAQDKAYTAAALKMFTHTALELSRGGALDGLNVTSNNRLSLLGGGAPLKIGGRIVGGLGVSGGTAQEDTDFAVFGAECMKFLTE